LKPALLLLLIVFALSTAAQKKERVLDQEKWTFFEFGSEKKWIASVPGNIHRDLQRNKIIEDPFFGDNEKKLKWIEEKSWTYECDFHIKEPELAYRNINLDFQGLDTYAEIYLNNNLLGTTDNMFRSWNYPIKQTLKKGRNKLTIVFQSAVKAGQDKASTLPYRLPGSDYVFSRKSAYQFGWDWGPRLVTCGIYKPIKLIFHNEALLQDVCFKKKHLNNDSADISLLVSTQAGAEDLSIIAEIEETGQRVEVPISKNGEAEVSFIINQPRLWWCRGMGKANLYHAAISIQREGRIIDSKRLAFGLRNMEWVQEKDEQGKSFYLKLNGVPVFAKGANMIPPEFFLSDIKESRYNQILEAAADANMNMIRVWGGGAYEQDLFYDKCDSLGILVWQDFMFACGMYPGDSSFLSNVKEEISEQVIRLRNHPCISLWCGNNEMDEGWKNWGWQKQFRYSKEDSLRIYGDYQKLFHDLIPTVLKELDPSRYYHPSSPMHGWGRKESLQEGDIHYWGIWWGMEPFEKYAEKSGRFVSEYGFQSLPDLASLQQFLPKEQLSVDSPMLKSHQKHPTGFETIAQYLRRRYKPTNSFDYFVYTSQLLQADAMQMAIEAHRSRKPYCMGSLYWQLNDCWPVVSWSSMDYFGRKKAAHYAISRSFEPIIISAEQRKDSLLIKVVSDNAQITSGMLEMEALRMDGTSLKKSTENISMNEQSGGYLKIITSTDLYIKGFDSADCVLKFRFTPSKNVLNQAIEKLVFLKYPADMKWEKPEITITQASRPGHIFVTCEKYLAKGIRLRLGNAEFSDNYFDLLPGTSKLVEIKTTSGSGISERFDNPEVISLFDTLP
jgi:beta-mannosidase